MNYEGMIRNDGRPTIAFLSDLGDVDDAVGMCKGQMLSISPDATIIDVCHQVEPFNISEGGRLLIAIPDNYPAHTVAGAIVYPETGTETRTIAVQVSTGHVYVVPNNGLITSVLAVHGLESVYEIADPAIIPDDPEPTFYGRDLIAIPTAHLAAGYRLQDVGPALADEEIIRTAAVEPELSADGEVIEGIVTVVDRPFGNVWTNVGQSWLEALGIGYGSGLRILVDDTLAFDLPLTRTFGDKALGAAVAYVNSRGHLALGCNRGNLAKRYNLTSGMKVSVQRDSSAVEGIRLGASTDVTAERALEPLG